MADNNKIEIRYVKESDRVFWFRLDRHLSDDEFTEKVRRRQGYVCSVDGTPAGLLRYNLFWDNTPFCTMLYIDEAYRGQGLGKRLIAHWEQDMRSMGYGMLMTSTQVDESAQHFYRASGYKDCGCLIIDVKGFEQPMEMFMVKDLQP